MRCIFSRSGWQIRFRSICSINGLPNAKPGSHIIRRRGAQRWRQKYHRRFSGAIEGWLDEGHGACVLRQPECRLHVETALKHFDAERCAQIAWVIMPNHVHVLFVLNAAWTLEDMVHSWKLYSSRKINKHLGRSGALWMKDYFDRLVRDQDHFANCVRYIRRNPIKAKLRESEYTLYESEMVRGIP